MVAIVAVSIWRLRLQTPNVRGALSSLFVQSHISKCRNWQGDSLQSLAPSGDGVAALDFRGGAQRDAIFQVPHFNFEMNEIWRVDDFNLGIHSASKSTPVVYKNFVFAASDSSRFYSLDKWTGREQWQMVFDDASRGIHSTPSFDEYNLYVGNYRGGLYKINQSTGALVWNIDLGMTLGASLLTLGSDLIAVPETVNPANGFLVRINKNSCEIKWRSSFLGEQSHSSPAYDTASNLLILGANNSVLQAFDASSGERIWHRKMKGQIKSTPRLFRGHVYFTSWGNELVKVRALDGEVIWSADIESRSQVSPVIIEEKNLVVASNSKGVIFGYDTESGKRRWRFDAREGREKDFENYATAHLASPSLLKSPGSVRILSYCSPRSLCLLTSEGQIEKRLDIPGIVTSSLFLDRYDPRTNSLLLPLAFREGPLVMYKWTFGAHP